MNLVRFGRRRGACRVRRCAPRQGKVCIRPEPALLADECLFNKEKIGLTGNHPRIIPADLPLHKQSQKRMEGNREGRLTRDPPHTSIQFPHPIRIEIPPLGVSFHTDRNPRAIIRYDAPIQIVRHVLPLVPLAHAIIVIVRPKYEDPAVCRKDRWKWK